MKSRTVPKLDSFEATFQHIANLQRSGYQPTGRWSLGQVCNHLASSMELMSGPMMRFMPRFVQRMFFGVFLRLTFLGKIGKLIGMRIPTILPQNEPVSDDDGLQRLQEAVAKVEATAPSQVDFHLWHCRHHLSYLAVQTQADANLKSSRSAEASLA